MLDEKDFRERMRKIENLTGEIEALPDANARAKAIELVQLIMDFHGAGLERMMEITAAKGAAGDSIFDDFAKDELVSNLLLLYGLHPLDLETRVRQALEKVRPSLSLHEGDVELLGVGEDGVVRLRLRGNCDGCPSSAMTLKNTIEEAIYAAAPDAAAIEVEGVTAATTAPSNGFVQIEKSNGGFTNCEFPASL